MKIQTDKGTTTNVHAITEGVRLFGKQRKNNTWDFVPSNDCNPATQLPKAKDNRKQGSWVVGYVPKANAPIAINADAAVRSQETLFERTAARRLALKHGSSYRPVVKMQSASNPVALQMRSRVAGSLGCTQQKRFRVEIADKVTGERVEVLCKLITYEVIVKSYGKVITFSTSNRAKGTFLDSRDGLRHPLSFAKTELARLLGTPVGAAQFRVLTGEAANEPQAVVVARHPATRQCATKDKRYMTAGLLG